MRIIPKNIDGILLLDKPANISSNAALQTVKKLFGAKKAGHTGSLDPLATGMLPICFGEATKFSQFLLDSDKEYQVTAQLGIKTTTGDAEGEVIQSKPADHISPETIRAVLPQFIGFIQQIPPMHSAVKQNGRPLYELARKGITVERSSRTVQIHALQLLSHEENRVTFKVHCSKGTYIRTLMEDMGEALGCGAHVSELHRTMVFPYTSHKMMPLSTLRNISQQQGAHLLQQYLLPVETSVSGLPAVKLSSSASFYMRTGQAVMLPHLPSESYVRIYSDAGLFMGVGEVLEDGRVAPRRLCQMVKTDDVNIKHA